MFAASLLAQETASLLAQETASLLAQETASLLAQETSTIPEAGGGAILVWLLLALGIVGLYVLISRTRKRSYKDYVSRADREAELKANDPDMRSED